MGIVTWDSVNKGTGVVLSNNDLTAVIPNTYNTVKATEGRESGKWYWEVSFSALANAMVGVINGIADVNLKNYNYPNARYYSNNGKMYSSNTVYGDTYRLTDIIGIALDLDKSEMTFYKNGVSQGVTPLILNATDTIYPAISSGGDTTGNTSTVNFGATRFKYPVPLGYYSYDGNQYGEVNKILIVLDDKDYKAYNFDTSSWEDFLISGESPTEQEYFDYGMNKEDIELIPESAWRELDGHALSILEYTDSPDRTESTVETETEPYTIYDEFGDTIEVLYYTDDQEKTEAQLEITANYSPLDELKEDFEVVTWTDQEDVGTHRILNMKALPQPQFITTINPQNIHGDFGGIIPEELQKGDKIGILRYLISPNGTEWMTWNGSSFVKISTVNMENIAEQGMSLDTINNIKQNEWNTWSHKELYVGIFLDEDIRSNAESVVESISYKSLIGKYTTKISDAKLYILNTKSTINVEFKGSTLIGNIDDEDKGKVQYRVLLNGRSYFPDDGSFTPLLPSPLNISITISNKDILIDENNVLRIEFQDYWGTTDYWERNFTGTYNGLIFLDESGEYYSTNIGDILKYLDFGVIVAGQTTLEHKVRIKNTYGFPVENIHIRANQEDFPDGLKAQFGTNNTSFEALSDLSFDKILDDGDEIDFYIRLSSVLETQPVSNGKFDIIVTADQVDKEIEEV